ncbi:MAG: sigma-70 family RNA polymerase sigma factor [Gemmataceae bacterium]|nr:sigma-70 family RNA polymerase sigma factor [Gemmataceae bacterium]
MDQQGPEDRLSDISTIWSALRLAHEGAPDAASAAQQLLLERYRPAVYRYLRQAVGDSSAAEDLTQEWALALVNGEFRNADPQRGRFRNYVKGVLFHLVSRYRKRQARTPQAMGGDGAPWQAIPATESDPEVAFHETWREELLARAWKALEDVQPTLCTVLRFRAAHQEMHSPQMAEGLSAQLGKPVTADWVRQNLGRARNTFADLLLLEVARSLDSPTVEALEEELRELNLLKYCKAALQRYV